MKPSLRAASDSVPLIYENGCHRGTNSLDATGCQFGDNLNAPLVFLFGDSHAAQWFPALLPLAEEGRIRLDTNTKSSCPSASITRDLSGVEHDICTQWRQSVIERIGKAEASTVILSNYGHPDADIATFERRWASGIVDTVEAFPAKSRPVILADTPDMGGSPPICLSSQVDQADLCAAKRSTALPIAVRKAEHAAAEATGTTHLDLNDYLCNDVSCPAVIGDLLVYRDSHHMTVSFSESLSPVLARALGWK